jgi:hypothetical protein
MGWKSGKKKTKSTSTFTPHADVQAAGLTAVGKAQEYADTPYEAYRGERVAPLSSNEQQAVQLAGSATGRYGEDINAARAAIGEGMQRWTEADQDAYMNPYIKGALDPVAREIQEQTARERNQLAGSLSSRGAFSGSRAILADREASELGAQRTDDLYSKGFAQAYESGADKFYKDQDNRFRGADSYMKLAGVESDLIDADTRRLMSTGLVERSVTQGMADFDYQQFTEARDWNVRQSQVITDTLRGVKGSISETRTSETETKEQGSGLGMVLGAAATIAGAYFTGGMSLIMQGAAAGAGMGEGSGDPNYGGIGESFPTSDPYGAPPQRGTYG